jgi:hypothetical protein
MALADGTTSFDAHLLDPNIEPIVARYNAQAGTSLNSRELSTNLRQDKLSLPKDLAARESLLAELDNAARARLLSQSDRSAFSWAQAVPNAHFKTAIAPPLFRVGVQRWIGDLPFDGPCHYCGAPLDKLGVHATGSCKRNPAKLFRHRELARVVVDIGHEHGLPCGTETPHLFGTHDRRRPADVAIDHLFDAKLCALDLTVTEPSCPTYSFDASRKAGHMAQVKEQGKRDKYGEACFNANISLCPVSFETSGRLSRSGFAAMKQLATKAFAFDTEAGAAAVRVQTKFILQRLSCTMLAENANMILACSGQSRFNRSIDREDAFAPFISTHDLDSDSVSSDTVV